MRPAPDRASGIGHDGDPGRANRPDSPTGTAPGGRGAAEAHEAPEAPDASEPPTVADASGEGQPVPPSEVAAWRALDDAVAIVRVAYDGPARRDELARFLYQVRDAVEQVMRGRAVTSPASRMLPVVRILDRLQRELIDRVRAESACDPAFALRLVGAVASLQSAHEEVDAMPHDLQHLSGREAVGLLVEIAHDLSSPLAAVLFLVDMLRAGRSGPVNALQSRQLGLVYGAAFGLSHLAMNLIDHVRGQERLVDHHPVPFSVSETLNSVRDIVAPMTEEKEIELRLAAPAHDARLGYPVALHRILLNLVSNAVKYTSRGWVSLEANEVTATRLRFAVSDTGPGVPRRIVAQLFEPFRSTPGAAVPSFSGSGLGLSISKRLVTLLGGDLRVTTATEKGTTFSFELELPPVA